MRNCSLGNPLQLSKTFEDIQSIYLMSNVLDILYELI